MSSSAPPHHFEALTKLDEDFNCPVCRKLMLPCYSFGCHQFCGSCADSLPNKHKCPACNKVWNDPLTRNAMITGLVEKAVAGQIFRCTLCQAILTGPVERDAHATTCAAAADQPQHQQEQQQQQQPQLAPPPPRPAPPPAPATELPPAPSKPASGAAAPAAAAAAALAPAPTAAASASASSAYTRPCFDCKESLPRASFTKKEWSRKDGVFRCTSCVSKPEEQRRREQQAAARQEEQKRAEQKELRRLKEEEQRRRKEEQRRLREQEEQRQREQDQYGVALINAATDGNVDTIRSLVARDDFAKFRDARNKNGQTALHVASRGGHGQSARALLEGGCDIALTDNNADSALHVAAAEGSNDALWLFVAHAGFAKVRDLRNKNGITALHLAALSGHTECARALVEGGCDISIVNNKANTAFLAHSMGDTPLHSAAWQGKLGVVRVLIAAADFAKIRHARNKSGFTALHEAAGSGHAECTGALLEAGCDSTLVDRDGRSPLHLAAYGGHVAVVRVLAAAAPVGFAKVRDLRTTADGMMTALYVAAVLGHTECVRALLEAGCDSTIRDTNGETALHAAASKEHVAVVRVLAAAPDFAKVCDLRGGSGSAALHLACLTKNADCVRALVEGGCDITVADSDGVTALDGAVAIRNVEMVRALAAAPGFAKICDRRRKGGDPALHVAAQAGHAELVRALLDGGCDIAAVDKLGLSALHHAAREGYINVIRVLVARPDFAKVRDLRSDAGTALHSACMLGHAECVRALLESGCDSALVSKLGETPLHIAANGNWCGLRVVAAADVDKIRARGMSAAGPAISDSGYTECVRALLDAGCGITLANEYGETALHGTALNGHAAAVRMLVAHPDIVQVRDLRTENGQTALDLARTAEIKKILRS